jgi:transcriptional regulator with XRE-family HTH domain
MVFGERVRQLREERFLSMAELADKAGISKNTLFRVETGNYSAIPRTVRKIAEALGVEPGALVTPEELRELRGNAQAA